ncbi:MAG: hypothetical protein WCK02_05985 [Bacteroidota bacterium]
MKKLLVLALFSSLLISCSTVKSSRDKSNNINSTTVKADGTSYEHAVVIKEKTETSGVEAEHKWLSKNYPNYTLLSQSLSEHKNKPYDLMNISLPSGEKKCIYFDISNFFGKF